MKQLAILRDYFRANIWRYVIGIFCLIFVDSMQLVTPKLTGTVADLLQEGNLDSAVLLKYAAIIVGLAVLAAAGRYGWRMYVMGSARRLDYYLRNKLFIKLQTLSAGFFNKHKTGDLMAHSTNDIQAVRMAFGQGIMMITDAAFLSIMTIVIMSKTISWKLTAVALLPLPLLVFVSVFFGRQIHHRFRAVQESFSRLTDKTQENLAGIRVVKSFVQEKPEIRLFEEYNMHNVNMNMKLVRIWGLFFPLIQFISALSYIAVIGYGGILATNSEITLGGFVSFLSYLGLLIWPIMAIGWVINIFQRGMASLERLNAIFAEIPDVADHENTLPVEHIDGSISIKNLTFAYPGASVPALQDINIELPQGKTLAIIGRTGSGKTTLINLLLRMYNPPAGSVFVDGYDVNLLPLNTLREGIGCVPQDNFLFSATVRENIGFAGTDYSDAEIENAARIAQVYDNIVDFPDGFETMVGERGVTLSGGQKQRISIARALIKNPKVLILDDSLSAVDTQTEEAILQGLKSFGAGRTNIIVSHRVSSIRHADEIIVLDGGKIVERGNHDSLLRNKGLYHDLYQKQLLEEEIAKVD